MSEDAWHTPGANGDGFVDVAVLRERARNGLETFVREFPAPGLSVVARATSQDGGPVPEKSGVQLLTVSIGSAGILKYLGRVAFVAKRPGNAYAHLVSVGRSERNDVTIGVDSVSKVHGYFVRDGDGWAFNDHGSTNGSFLDGERLEPGEKTSLYSGCTLRLGLEVTVEYRESEDLWRHLLA